jgi:hypothetical protein
VHGEQRSFYQKDPHEVGNAGAWRGPCLHDVRFPKFPGFPCAFPMAFPAGRKEGREEAREAGGEGRKGKERKGKLGFASRDGTWTTLDRLRRRLYAGRKLTSRTHLLRHGRASLFPSTSPTPHLVKNRRVQGRLSLKWLQEEQARGEGCGGEERGQLLGGRVS